MDEFLKPEIGPMETVEFGLPGDVFRTRWQVTMNEDGSLTVLPVGRRPGRIHLAPQSQNCVIITTDRITKGA